MKVVIPMAGRGSRFADRGYTTPKPLIPVAGQPMILRALHSLENVAYSQMIFIALQEHEQEYGVSRLLRETVGEHIEVILLDGVTEGQLCTVLTARDYINTDEDVLVISSDTYVKSDLASDLANRTADCHGLISVAALPGDRWSFARTDSSGKVVEVAEKVRISDHASTGIYYFSNGRELLAIGDEMVLNEEKTRGEYYVIPVYQKYIEQGWRVDISPASEMWDMGTPEALAEYEKHLAEINV